MTCATFRTRTINLGPGPPSIPAATIGRINQFRPPLSIRTIERTNPRPGGLVAAHQAAYESNPGPLLNQAKNRRGSGAGYGRGWRRSARAGLYVGFRSAKARPFATKECPQSWVKMGQITRFLSSAAPAASPWALTDSADARVPGLPGSPSANGRRGIVPPPSPPHIPEHRFLRQFTPFSFDARCCISRKHLVKPEFDINLHHNIRCHNRLRAEPAHGHFGFVRHVLGVHIARCLSILVSPARFLSPERPFFPGRNPGR